VSGEAVEPATNKSQVRKSRVSAVSLARSRQPEGQARIAGAAILPGVPVLIEASSLDGAFSFAKPDSNLRQMMIRFENRASARFRWRAVASQIAFGVSLARSRQPEGQARAAGAAILPGAPNFREVSII
jgi:hypothetical protein